MHGPGHQYPQMNHGNGNAHMAHMQPPIPGVQGMQGMQAFNGMMMNQMPMLGMPGMPDMPPHMMAGTSPARAPCVMLAHGCVRSCRCGSRMCADDARRLT
jgi:hypothetical protein